MDRPPTAPIAAGRYTLSLRVYLTGPLTTDTAIRYFELEKAVEVRLGPDPDR